MAARYKILEELGAGGAGAVFKAYDTQLDRYVAVKRLMTKEESERQDAQSGTLKKEAASLAALQHPNIVSVYDLGSDDQGFFMVMEMVDGETLSDWVRGTPMGLSDFQELATQTLEAVMTAHSQSILHRDLKPENIKVKRLPGGRIQVKVLDFGLARMSYGAKKMTEDQSGNVVGSIYYMAPEQFLRKPVDIRTDLYSLGCVFYQALTCRRPYQDETVQGVMNAHLKHMVHPLNTIAPTVPQPVCDWVMWLINAEPQHRPASAQAALTSLREIISAGWFNESTTSAVPVAIPEGEHQGGWHQTSTVPRAPTSAHVSTVSGAASQRITGTVPRPSTAAVRPPAGPVRPVTGQSPPIQAPVEKRKLPVWIWPAAAAVVLGAAWFFWPKDAPTTAGAKPSATTAPKPPTTVTLSQRPADFLQKGAILHYRAGEKMDAWADPGKPTTAATSGKPVKTWHDLASAVGDGWLGVTDGKKEACPKLAFEKPSDFKSTIGLLRFDVTQGLSHKMDAKDQRLVEYPLHPDAAKKGLTVIMLVKPKIDQLLGVRLLRLGNAASGHGLSLRAFANNEWKFAIAIGEEHKEVVVKGRDAKKFSLIGATWDPVAKKILLNVRTSDGNKTRAETGAPSTASGVLHDLRLGEPSKGTAPTTTGTTEDRFAGEIVELIVWPYAMDWEERSGQEWKLMQHYFSNPGSRY